MFHSLVLSVSLFSFSFPFHVLLSLSLPPFLPLSSFLFFLSCILSSVLFPAGRSSRPSDHRKICLRLSAPPDLRRNVYEEMGGGDSLFKSLRSALTALVKALSAAGLFLPPGFLKYSRRDGEIIDLQRLPKSSKSKTKNTSQFQI